MFDVVVVVVVAAAAPVVPVWFEAGDACGDLIVTTEWLTGTGVFSFVLFEVNPTRVFCCC